MFRHGPTCLPGPVSIERAWWSADHSATAAAPNHADDIRHDLIARVRAEIAAGTYDTPERWDLALERLGEDFFPA